MAAMTAKEHEDYDSVLEEEERTENDGESVETGSAAESVAVSVSDGETPSVESVSAVSASAE